MTKMDWIRFFQSHPTLKRLADAEFLRRLEDNSDYRECAEKFYEPGKIIIEQGQTADTIYFIGEGTVVVSALGPDREEIELTKLKEGNFFGELSLLGEKDRPRSATVTAESECVLLQIKATEFRKALHQYPDVFSELLLVLSERLRQLAERVAEVAYQDVDNKVRLVGTKLDAELKAMNASLVASQAVFEQVTARAHEVLESGEKFWNRATWVGTTLVGGLSILLPVLGFVGYSTFDHIREDAEDAAKEIEETAESVKEAGKASKDVMGLRDALLGGAALSILPKLFDPEDLSGSRLISAQKLFDFVLRSNDIELSREVLIDIQRQLVDELRKLGVEGRKYDKSEAIRDVLSIAIENKDDMNINSLDVAISYYLTLVSLAPQRNLLHEQEYYDKLHEFKYYRRKQDIQFSKEDRVDFDPILFYTALQHNKSIDDNDKTDIVIKISAASATLVSD